MVGSIDSLLERVHLIGISRAESDKEYLTHSHRGLFLDGIEYPKFDIAKKRSQTIALQTHSPGNFFLYRVTLSVDSLAYLASRLRFVICVSHHLKHISQTYAEELLR